MEIENEINNEIKTEKNNFFKDIIGKTINNAIDIGLKSILPDLIEEQVIDIKDALIENGLKTGIEVAINSAMNLGKSAKGIFTGNFENISQIEIAIGDAGIIDTISELLDKTIDKITKKGYINDTISGLIKGGKNIILENIKNNIKDEINIQGSLLKKLNENIKKWEVLYNERNFQGMTEAYNEINKQLSQIVPLEDTIKNANKINIIHNLIKNNGQNFEISNLEKELTEKLAI